MSHPTGTAAALAVLFLALGAAADDWASVDSILENAIAQQVFPGCVAGVKTSDGLVYFKAHGQFTYGKVPPYPPSTPDVQTNTLFDLASLTKVTATTTAVAQFYERGELDLDMEIADEYLLGPKYAQNGKGPIVVRNCLLHNAGYPPDPVPGYSTKDFGCPQTSNFHPIEDFSCVDKIFDSLLAQTLENPIGQKYVYSDLSMITMQFVVGTLAEKLGYVNESQLLPQCHVASRGLGLTKSCYYEAYVRTHVLEAAGMTSSGFLPPKSEWNSIMPTWVDDDYRHEVVQGQVSDENSYALGGVAGHAGLFSNVPDLMKLMSALMWATDSGPILNATTVKTFTTAYNLTQSSRALGWDTNDYKMNAYRGCGNFSHLTYTHTGYTGTELCNDPTRSTITILLTNRVYPDKTGQMDTIHTTRQAFNNEVLKVLESQKSRK